jgi:hypothetical protein
MTLDLLFKIIPQTHLPTKPTNPSSSYTMSKSSLHIDDSDELALSKIMKTCVVEKNVLDSFAERLVMKIKARLGVEYLSKNVVQGSAFGGIMEVLMIICWRTTSLNNHSTPESMYRTRFCMNKDLFLHIVNTLG